MNWTEVTILTTPQAEELITAVLYETGVDGINIEDPSLIDEANRNTHDWDVMDEDIIAKYSEEKCLLKAYYSPEANIEEVLMQIREGIENAKAFVDVGPATVTSSIVSEQDWENSWKKYYKPVYIGENIVIKPVWEEIPQKDGKIVIELDPGMAFGTGTHETTRMCLEVLERTIKKGDKVLDIGTGSGILSIGAVKMGAESCFAVDIDPVAVKVVGENAEINGVNDKITTVIGNLADKVTGKYQVVVANIIADAIIALSPDVRQFMAEGGVYITSGIIHFRLEDVVEKLKECGFEIREIIRQGDWAAVVCI
ncbi:MAG: 50S ribosomal protein L11 methyltransferase [Clostridia bacterium]|nr:50S ribosomal protein L11 methyltransferase [Clostridia bacterium]